MAPEEGGRLVSSGSFKVDRAQALEKLMRFALPDPAWAVLSLARVARASEATRFEVERGRRGELTVRFDGTPLPRALLEAPYDALFARADRREPRGRDLAVALLSMLRLEPAHVTVRAGVGAERVTLRLNGRDPETVERLETADTDTVVRFLPGPRTPAAWSGLEAAFRERCALLRPFPLLDGEQIRPPPLAEEALPLAAKDLFGRVELPARRLALSRLELYRYGVLINAVDWDLRAPAVLARLESAAFRMNASQTAVVRDATFKAAAAAAAAAAALAERVAALQTERAPQLAQLLRAPALYEAYRHETEDWLSGGGPGVLGTLGRLLVKDVSARTDRVLGAQVRADARRMCWLRDCAAVEGAGAAAKSGAAARAAPAFLDPLFQGLTRDQLAAVADVLGFIPFTQAAGGGSFPETTLLLPTSAERDAAERWFPRRSLVEASAALLPSLTAARNRPLLSRVGVVEAAARRPLTGDFPGELALPLKRGDGARIHVFSGGSAVRSLAPSGALRYVAAVSVTGPCDAPRARALQAAVESRLEELYAGAATDWSPGAASTAGESLHAHLLDALVHWAAAPPAWLESLPLFSGEAGRFDLKGLRARLDAGDTLFFGPSRPVLGAPRLLFVAARLGPVELAALFPGSRVKEVPGGKGFCAVWSPVASRRDALGALEGVLREHGTHLGGDPAARRHLLAALAETFAPWDGAASDDPRRERVREHTAFLPLFAGAEEPLTTARVAARVASGRPLAYGPPGPAVEIVMPEEERAPFERLWPRARSLAVESGPAAPAPAAGTPPLAFSEPMLVAAKADGPGLEALIGLPVDALPEVAVVLELPEGPVDCALPTPGARASGRILIRPSGWSGPLHQRGALARPLAEALRELYIAFMTRLVEKGLPSDPGWERLRPALLMLAAPAKGPAGPWQDLRARIEALPLFKTLGGQTASLADLRGAAQGGVLACARAPRPAPAGAEGVPIVTTRALLASALGVELVEFDDAHAAAPDGAPSPRATVADHAERLLRRVRGRKAVDPRLVPRAGAFGVAGGPGTALVRADEGAWTVDSSHPAARLALDPALDAATQAAYLLSAAATTMNRQGLAQTDAEDSRFQELLAEAAADAP